MPRTNQVIRELRENGPATADDLGRNASTVLTPKSRNVIYRFRPIFTGNGQGSTSLGATRNIYYLRNEHRPEEVITAWVEDNPRITEDVPIRAFISGVADVGPEFKEAASKVAKQVYGDDAWNEAYLGTGGDGGSNQLYNKLLEADPDELQ